LGPGAGSQLPLEDTENKELALIFTLGPFPCLELQLEQGEAEAPLVSSKEHAPRVEHPHQIPSHPHHHFQS